MIKRTGLGDAVERAHDAQKVLPPDQAQDQIGRPLITRIAALEKGASPDSTPTFRFLARPVVLSTMPEGSEVLPDQRQA